MSPEIHSHNIAHVCVCVCVCVCVVCVTVCCVCIIKLVSRDAVTHHHPLNLIHTHTHTHIKHVSRDPEIEKEKFIHMYTYIKHVSRGTFSQHRPIHMSIYIHTGTTHEECLQNIHVQHTTSISQCATVVQ